MTEIDLFNKCDYKKPVKLKEGPEIEKKYDIADLQHKTIDKQYNDWLKQKQGMKYERVSLNNFGKAEIYDDNSTDNFIDQEVRNLLKKKKWNGLPKSSKWTLIKEYCEKHDEEKENLKIYKGLLEKKGNMTVVYDNNIGEIQSISI
jgi:hypothetical protein